MTENELRQYLESSPDFLQAVDAAATEGATKCDVILTHHAGFQTLEEMTLLGCMAKYAALRGVGLQIVPVQ